MRLNSPAWVTTCLTALGLLALSAAAGAATRRWTGQGDGTSWSNTANWQGGVVPQASDDVVLDHSSVAAGYTVQLPGGSVTVSVHRLTLDPQGSAAITLVLPTTNTANPGLRAGDAVAGSDDIVLRSGAVLRNASTGSFGNGIEANSVANGTVRIENGGKYVHATLRSAAGIAPLLSIAPGTERGTFEYDVPGTGTFNVASSGRTYGSVILKRTAGAATYGALGSSDWRIRGDLTIGNAVTLNSTMTGALRLEGSLSNAGTQIVVPAAQPVYFQGSGVQTLSGSGGGLTVGGTGRVESSSTLALVLPLFVNGTLTIDGTLRLDTDAPPVGSGTYAYHPTTGTLAFNGSTNPAPLDVVREHYWPTTNGPSIVLVTGAGGVTLDLNRSVGQRFVCGGPVIHGNRLTLSGVVEMPAGGSFSGAPTYAGGATLRYTAGHTVGDEWGPGAVEGAGVARDVVVDAAAGTVMLPASDRHVPGDLTVANGTLELSPVTGDLALDGSATLNGAVVTHGRPLSFVGSGLQTISATSAVTLGALRLAKAGGTLHLSADVTLGGTAVTALRFDGGAGDVLVLDGRTLTLSGALAGTNPSGALRGDALAALEIGGAGLSGTVTFASGGATLRRLHVAAAAPGAALTLGTDLTVQESLQLDGGVVVTGSNALVLAPGGSLTRVAGWVAGRLRQTVPTGALVPVDCPIGGLSDYAPVTLQLANVTGSGTLTASTSAGDQPDLALDSGFDPAKTVNRFWTLNGPALTFGSYAATVEYPAGEVDAGADPGQFALALFDGVWVTGAPGEQLPTRTGGGGFEALGDLAAGELPRFTVGVTSDANGSVTRAPDQPGYFYNQVVRLHAYPNVGYHLAHWGGDAAGYANPLEVHVQSDANISAVFAINRYTLDVSVVGSGTVSREPDQLNYVHGSVVFVTATPAANWHFARWSGDASGSDNPLELTMLAPLQINAIFEPDSFPVEVTVIGDGSVTRDPLRVVYPFGSTVTLTAVPQTGRHFVSWGGDASGSDNPLGLLVDGPKSVSATFAINTYTLTTAVSGNGSVTRDPDQATYVHGTTVTLTAIPDPLHHFVGWSGSATGNANPLVVTMDANKTITATFAIDTHTLTVHVVGGGSVQRNPDLPAYDTGSTVTLTAVPDSGQAFAGWSGDATGYANPVSVVMDADRTVTATFELNTPKFWTGLGDAASWADGLNWVRGTPPAPEDEVVLDNSRHAGTYAVILPGGAASVGVVRLTIRPSTPNTITLVLPAANTANPGLSVGDGMTGTDDIVVGPGGVLVNASGASAGNGVQAISLLNGRVRMENGGRYLHATLRSAAGVAPLLSTAPGTESGVFEYDVPGTATYNVGLSGRTYGELVLTRTAGPATYGAVGANASRIRGALRTGAGVTLNSTMTGALDLEGDVDVDGTSLVLPASQAVSFQGAGVQTLSGTSGLTLQGASTIEPQSTLALGATPLSNVGALQVQGRLRLGDGAAPGGGGTYAYDAATGVLEFANASGPVAVGNVAYWPDMDPPARVEVAGAGGISIATPRAMATTLGLAGPLTSASALTIAGTLELESGGSLDGAPAYTGAARLRYAVPRSVGAEWGPGAAVGSGVPRDVEVSAGAGVVLLPAENRAVPGSLTVTSGTLRQNPSAGDLVLLGNLSVAGQLETSGHALVFLGAGSQTISAGAPLVVDYLRLNKFSGDVTLGADVTAKGSSGPVLEFYGSAGDRLALNGHTLTAAGSIGGSDATGAVRGGAGSRLVLTGSGSVGSLRLDGGAPLQDLVVDLGGSNPNVTLGTPVTVTGTLSLAHGVVVGAGNPITLALGATVTRTSGFVDGPLAKTFAAGSGADVTFEVGSGSRYAPVSLSIHAVTAGGTLVAQTTSGDHPSLGGASLDPLHTVNRYWTLTSGGAAFDNASATFEYTGADVDPGSDPLGFETRRYSGGAWAATTPGTRTATSAQALGLTALGDFAVGKPTAFTVSLTSTSGGSAAKDPDLALYPAGSSVTLTATPTAGHHFVGWSGDASGSTNPLSLVVNSNLSIVAQFASNGLKQWLGASGGGDGASWSDPLNWSDGAVPVATEEVELDNSAVGTSYTVTLPGGATTTTIRRATLTPAAGRTITLVLPSSNTADPGLLVGDGQAATDDIVLAGGAVLRNASGAATGPGIALSTSANGGFRIESGGRYVHATPRSPGALLNALSTATGTETGEFEYDVPGTSSYALDVSGRTYGSLTLTRTAGSATYTAAGSNPLTVRGDLKTNAGVTLSSTMTGALTLYGDLTVFGQNLSLPAGQAVNFSGGLQTVSGSVNITVAGSSSVAAGATLGVSAPNFLNNGTMTVHGALQLNPGGVPGGTGTYSYDAAGGTLVFNNTSLVTFNNDRYWPTTNGPVSLTIQNTGGVSMNSTRTVTGLVQVGAGLAKASSLTASGTLRMSPGGVMSTQSPKYSGTATLEFATSATVGLEWIGGTTVGSGVPRSVTVQSGTVTLPSTDRNVLGTLTIDPGATLAGNASAGNLVVRGDATVNGSLLTNGRTVVCTGAATQNLSASAPLAVDYLTIDKSGGLVRLLTDLSLTGTGAPSLAFEGTTGDVLDLNGHALALAGALGGADTNGQLTGSTASALALSGTGALGTVRFSAGAQSLQNLLLTGASPTLTLGTPLTVSGTLGLGGARVTTGANVLAVASGGTVTRGSGFVIGNLKKSVGTGSSVAAAFEVGTGSVYSPVSLVIGSVSTAGTVTGTAFSGDHPQIGTSGLDPTKTVNRYWTLTAAGLAFDQYAATFNFAASDVDAGANPAQFAVRRYSGGIWNPALTGARTSTSTEATGLTAFSDFAIGAVAQYTLTVTTVGDGSVARNPDLPVYDAGTSVTLTATSTAGNAFLGWSGDTTTTANPLTWIMNKNRSVTATFTYTLAVNVVGSGSVTRSPDQPNYAPGSTVTLTAVPQTGTHFVGWSGDASGSTNPLAVTMSADKNITATFAINTYTLALSSVGHGAVSKSPDLATYTHGATVTLTATPEAGYNFLLWSGDTASSANPLTVVMTRNRSIVGNFPFALTVTPSAGGSVTRNPDQPSYAPGTIVMLTAVPQAGYHFVSWGGDASGTQNPISVTMNADKNITATFAINQYTLTVTVTGNGSVARAPDQPTYPHGTQVTLTATADPGWHFTGWGGDASGTTNPLTLTLNSNKNLTATFQINEYTLDVTTVGSGYVTQTPDQPTYSHGTPVTLTAVSFAPYHFASWSGDASGSANPLSLVMDGNKSVTAVFEVDSYTLTLATAGSGSIGANPAAPTYPHGSGVTLTASPAAGRSFIAWGGDTSATVNPLALVMTRNRSITATFTVGLAVAISGNGTVGRQPDAPDYPPGSEVTLTATPDAHHHFVGWSGDAGGAANPLTLTLSSERSITATFAVDSFPVTATTTGGGSVTRDPDLVEYPYGSSMTLTALPDVGRRFSGWTGDLGGAENPATLTVDGPKDVTANFVPDTYTVVVQTVGGGSVTRDPDQPAYEDGSQVTLKAVPDMFHHFVGWSGDASGATNPITLTVNADRHVTATFAIDTYAIDVTVQGKGSVSRAPSAPAYPHGQKVTLEAIPAPGWTFMGWGGDLSGMDSPIEVVVTRAYSITVAFADLQQPTAAVLEPNGGERLVPGNHATLRWTATDLDGVASVDLVLVRADAEDSLFAIAESLPNTGAYDWLVQPLPSEKAYLRVTARDTSGNAVMDQSDEAWAIDTPPLGVPQVAATLQLMPVSPNPMRSAARLRYVLPESRHVRLSVVDVQGREMAVLVDGPIPAGSHEAEWRGRVGGTRVPAGVYFARLDVAGERRLRRFVVTP